MHDQATRPPIAPIASIIPVGVISEALFLACYLRHIDATVHHTGTQLAGIALALATEAAAVALVLLSAAGQRWPAAVYTALCLLRCYFLFANTAVLGLDPCRAVATALCAVVAALMIAGRLGQRRRRGR